MPALQLLHYLYFWKSTHNRQNRIDPSPHCDSGCRLSSARGRCHAARGTPRTSPSCHRLWGWCIPPAAKPMSKQFDQHERLTERCHKQHGAGGGPHLDLPERDEQALLELGVEAEQLRCPPEVAGGGGERVHRGGNFFQEEGTRITRTCCGLWPRKGAAFPAPRRRRQKQEAQARATTTTRARSGRPKKGRRRGWDEERTRRVSSEDRGGRPGREGWRSGVNRRDVLIARGIERGGGGGGGGGAGIRLEDRIDARRGAEFRLVVRGSRVK
jgi:hypothetical protein